VRLTEVRQATEAFASNVFGFHDGVFLTHPANKSILNGITRRCVIKAINKLGYSWKEEAMTFLMRIAFEAEEMNHHPEIENVYNKIHLSLTLTTLTIK
jgi:branched-subunit amino acid aminotransferase/4-amino-4-deoxychorismate lyase